MLALALPVMAARVGLILQITVDSIMTGHAGAAELAHYGISMAPQVLLLVIGIGLSVGTVVLVGQADGANRPRDCGEIWHGAMAIAAVFGGVAAGILLFGEEILLLLGQSDAMAAGGGQALTMVGLGLPAILMFVATGFLLEGLGRPRAVMVVALAANIPNAALNWLLIEGHWGFPAMGAAGATLATTVSRWAMLAALVTVVMTMRDRAHYGVTDFSAVSPRTIRRLLWLGAPLALTTGLEAAHMAALATFSGWLGETAMASWQACVNVISIAFMLALGMSTATTVRVANAVGRGDRAGVALAGWLGLALIAGIMLLGATVLVLLRPAVAELYSDVAAVQALTVAGLLWAAIILPFDSGQAVLMGAHRGAGDVLLPVAMQGIAFWGVGVPAAYLLAILAEWGLPGVLAGMLCGMIVSSSLLATRFAIISRRDLRPM